MKEPRDPDLCEYHFRCDNKATTKLWDGKRWKFLCARHRRESNGYSERELRAALKELREMSK